MRVAALGRLLFGLCAAVVATGCRKVGTDVVIQYPGGHWEFAPGEKTLFTYGHGGSVSAWDISGQRVAWSKPFKLDIALTVSASGEHVAVIAANSAQEAALFTLMRASTGESLGAFPLARGTRPFFDDPAFFSLSHDGSWVAFGMAVPGEVRNGVDSLCLAPLPGGTCAWFSDPADAVEGLAFDPRALRIAVRWRVSPHKLDVYEHGGGSWKRVQRWEGAVCPRWTARGLTFLQPDGLHIFDRDADVLAVRGAFIGKQGRECDSFTVSADGAWLLSWAGWELTVWSTATGAKVLHHAWKKKEPLGIRTSGFSGTRLRTFTGTGLLLQFDLATGALVKSTDYGVTTGSDKGWSFHEGATEFDVYTPLLSPSGDWLLIRKSQGGITLTRL